jgi:hypothetical protein
MRNMRKTGLIGALALAMAVAVAGIAGADGATQGSVTQTLEASVTPNKLPKKVKKGDKPKGVSLNVAVGIRDNAAQKPPASETTDILIPKDIIINTKGLKTCDPNAIATANTAQAKATCGKAEVGEGSASATCSPNQNPPDIPGVVVTAFNGTKQNGNPVLLLHTVANLGGTEQIQILPGELQKGPAPYRYRLHVVVPPLAGGACSIVDFETTVGGFKFKTKNGKVNYAEGTCKNGSSMQFGSQFNYASNPQGVSSLAPTDTVPCTAKG